SEFAPDGTLLLDGQLPIGVRSYRAFVRDWVGHPTGQPKILARANPAGGFVIFASWNGATEIDRWTILAGPNKTRLAPVGSQEWTGFETAIVVNAGGPYFAAVALDKNGNELGQRPPSAATDTRVCPTGRGVRTFGILSPIVTATAQDGGAWPRISPEEF